MDNVIWWIGAVHLAAYLFFGACIVAALGIVKLHMMAKVMSRIIVWHIARARWKEQAERGVETPEPTP